MTTTPTSKLELGIETLDNTFVYRTLINTKIVVLTGKVGIIKSSGVINNIDGGTITIDNDTMISFSLSTNNTFSSYNVPTKYLSIVATSLEELFLALEENYKIA